MEPTVELKINSSTGAHTIELGCADNRFSLSSAMAARLAADLTTVLAFTLQDRDLTTEEVTAPAKLTAVPDAEVETTVPRLNWHRDGKPGSGRYKAVLPSGKTEAEAYPATRGKGWDVKIGGKKINTAPIARKTDAYELVGEALVQQTN